MSWAIDPPITPMEARVRDTFPEPPGWAYEPKWDGFRAVAWGGPNPRLDSRNHKPLLRYFPELADPIASLPPGAVVDSEVVVVMGDVTNFDALQLRIHPAESRIAKLSAEIPAALVAFDLLAIGAQDLRTEPFSVRRTRLQQILGEPEPPWYLTPTTDDVDVARRWFDEFEKAGCDGIIAKELSLSYVEGKRKMIKVKHRRTADVVVGGYRVHKEGGKIGSLLLGLFDSEGRLHFVGHCSGFSNQDRVKLLETFMELKADESFGSDARRPGMPHRWGGQRDSSFVPVKPGVVVEISYDQITGGRFRHATRFERWRPDKDPEQCTIDQMDRPSGVGFSDVVI